MAKKAKPGAPRLDPKDWYTVTKGDLDDGFRRLASAPPTRENREPTRQELSQRYRLVRRDG